MKLSATLLYGLGVMALSAVLGSCTVAVEEGGPGYHRPPPPEQRYCTREYAPVCARRGHDRQSFANGCLAERAGYRIVSRGTCRGDFDRDDRPTVCTREYAPVCAQRRGRYRTFANACEARAADYRIVSRGSCRG